MRRCRICGERPCNPSRARISDYRCSRCFAQTPSRRRYLAAHKKAVDQRSNARLIHIGARLLGRVKTAEQAAQINAHIRRRLSEFKAVQRAEAS